MRIFRIVLGSIVGYILSAATSIAWFVMTRHLPTDPATVQYIAATALAGIVLSLVCGYIAAYIARTWIGAAGVTALLVLVSLWSIVEAHQAAHSASLWSPCISIFLMAPAAILGGRARVHRPSLSSK